MLLLLGDGRQVCRRCKIAALDGEAEIQEPFSLVAFIVFAWFALIAVIGGAWTRARYWIAAELRHIRLRIWNWLTLEMVCGWCKRVIRSRRLKWATPNITHGICPDCKCQVQESHNVNRAPLLPHSTAAGRSAPARPRWPLTHTAPDGSAVSVGSTKRNRP